MIKGLSESHLKHWIEDSLKNNTNTLAAGYQGKTFLYNENNIKLVIKVPHGTGLLKYIHTLTVRHEYNAYQQLDGFEGAPKCYGLIDNQFLVLEFIDGQPIRNQRPANPEEYFKLLFELVQQMHKRHVTHADLKRKDNLLITSNDQPCLIDFGTAIIEKTGFHPINRYLFKLAKQFDYNSWIKHKYHSDIDNLSDQDSKYFKRTFIERLSSFIKKLYGNIKSH